MIPQKYRYYLKRFQEIGFATSSQLLYHKLKRRQFIKNKRHSTGYLPWDVIAKKYTISPFGTYFEKIKSLTFFDNILQDPAFTSTWPKNFLDQSQGPRIDLLGFGRFTFNPENMPWHDDITVKTPSPTSWQTSFYSDIGPANFSIHLASPTAMPDTRRSGVETDSSSILRSKMYREVGFRPDIKIPWELSRMQHLFPLGLQFQEAQKTDDLTRAEKYAHIFQTNVSDWIKKNPYLIGVNWVCPMEVGIRALNLVWGFHFFKKSHAISKDFWQRFFAVLFHHAEYLASNWEVSDKPNNHYLADLLGYIYISTLLIDIKIIYQTNKWVEKEIIKELSRQILPDGTSYEGSTAYHRLDTEMILHFMLLDKYANTINSHTLLKETFDPNLSSPSLSGDPAEFFVYPGSMSGMTTKAATTSFNLETLYQKMLTFLRDCHDASGNFVQIGDNDSGKILVGINQILKPAYAQVATSGRQVQDDNSQTCTLTTYSDFGLSILRTSNWHITFRHPRYKKGQPTGHFHQDLLSFTLSIDGDPIIVDPGSYCYTSHPKNRNIFRSANRHNTFYIKEKNWGKSNLETLDLFQLPRIASPLSPPRLHQNQERFEDTITIQDTHQEYAFCALTPHRKLVFDQKNEQLCITDWWSTTEKIVDSYTSLWSLNFAPSITLEKRDIHGKKWLIKKQERDLALLITSNTFALKKAMFSPRYGSLQTSLMLTASAYINLPQTILIQRLDN